MKNDIDAEHGFVGLFETLILMKIFFFSQQMTKEDCVHF